MESFHQFSSRFQPPGVLYVHDVYENTENAVKFRNTFLKRISNIIGYAFFKKILGVCKGAPRLKAEVVAFWLI